jgi:hypothetical protein
MTGLAQITGVAVTSIIVLGSDLDVVFAVPAGILAGALAIFFARLAELKMAERAPRKRKR